MREGGGTVALLHHQYGERGQKGIKRGKAMVVMLSILSHVFKHLTP